MIQQANTQPSKSKRRAPEGHPLDALFRRVYGADVQGFLADAAKDARFEDKQRSKQRSAD